MARPAGAGTIFALDRQRRAGRPGLLLAHAAEGIGPDQAEAAGDGAAWLDGVRHRVADRYPDRCDRGGETEPDSGLHCQRGRACRTVNADVLAGNPDDLAVLGPSGLVAAVRLRPAY